MQTGADSDGGGKRRRLQAVDVYRGLALIAMAIYHGLWDLAYYRLIEAGIGVDPLWVTAQRGILTAFIVLSGASLALAHEDGIRWRGFWRREALLVVAAAGVSLVTWFQFGDYFAYFGVLHALALFALLALPFVRAPLWVGAVAATVALVLPLLVSSDAFDPRWLAWIGFFRTTPDTADLVPVFPWFGVMLIGVLGMRLLRGHAAFGWRSAAWPVRALALLGRWSLLFYLVHQPLLFGIITPIANALDAAEQAKLTGFVESCTASCGATHEAPFCTAYCRCALDITVRDNLWGAPESELGGMSRLCTAMAE